jgi:hypothetical protein
LKKQRRHQFDLNVEEGEVANSESPSPQWRPFSLCSLSSMIVRLSRDCPLTSSYGSLGLRRPDGRQSIAKIFKRRGPLERLMNGYKNVYSVCTF